MANIYHYRLKIYPDGSSEYVEFIHGKVTTDNVIKDNGMPKENNIQLRIEDANLLPTRFDNTELMKLQRRKTAVKDYVMSGNFYFFGTLTFRHQDAHDSLDEAFRKKMILFTRMLRRRDIRYYMVAERHTGGGLNHGKIHLHGLFSENLETKQSPHSRKYRNIPLWHHGFSSVEKIRDQTATANYVTKYVTKEALEGKSVWVSQGLQKPEVLYNVPDLLTPILSTWDTENVKITIRSR